MKRILLFVEPQFLDDLLATANLQVDIDPVGTGSSGHVADAVLGVLPLGNHPVSHAQKKSPAENSNGGRLARDAGCKAAARRQFSALGADRGHFEK